MAPITQRKVVISNLQRKTLEANIKTLKTLQERLVHLAKIVLQEVRGC